MSQKKKPTITKYLLHTMVVFLSLVWRNIWRVRKAHYTSHRMREGAIRPRFERSEAFRKRYSGRHFFKVWKYSWT